MEEQLALMAINYLSFVDLCYVFKLRNYWIETRPGYKQAERDITNPCGFSHSFVPKLWPIMLPTPFEYAYIIGQYAKDYKKEFPDAGFLERYSAWFLNGCSDDGCELRSRKAFEKK